MSKCDVTLEFDREDRTYAPADRVAGTARLRATDEFEFKRVVLVRRWRTHGRGSTARGDREEIVLEDGPGVLRPGEEREYRFEFAAPAGPYTYRGHYLNVDWYVRAQVDVAWARDPKAETEIIVPPPPAAADGDDADEHVRATPVSELPARVRDQLDSVEDAGATVPGVGGQRTGRVRFGSGRPGPKSRKLLVGCGVALAVMFGVPLLILAYTVVRNVLSGNTGLETVVVPGVVVLVFGVVLGRTVYRLVRSKIAERRLGEVDLKLMTHTLTPGDGVSWFLRFAPTRDVDVGDVRAVLRARERVIRGSGTDRRTFRHAVLERSVDLETRRRIEQGEDFIFPGRLEVPPDAPLSFSASRNHLEWELEVKVEIPGWPDWVQTVPLEVRAPEPDAVAAGGG